MWVSVFPVDGNLPIVWVMDGKEEEPSLNLRRKIENPGRYQILQYIGNHRVESQLFEVGACIQSTENLEVKGEGSGKENAEISAVLPTITSESSSTCNGTKSITMQASPVGQGYLYKWFKWNFGTGDYEIISGAKSSTYTTNMWGYYEVSVDDGVNLPGSSNPYYLSNSSFFDISDPNGSSLVYGSPGESIQLQLNVDGPDGPYEDVAIRAAHGYAAVLNGNTSPLPFTVKPIVNTVYKVEPNASVDCEGGTSQSYAQVVVDPNTSVDIGIPASLNVCAGGSVDIPYTTLGTWPPSGERKMYLDISSSDFQYRTYANSGHAGYLTANIPSNVPLNTELNVRISGDFPYFGSNAASYKLKVTQTGCTPKAYIQYAESNFGCQSVELSARPYIYPNTDGNVYQWYFNDSPIDGADQYTYLATQTGNYKLKVTQPSYSSISDNHYIEITGFEAKITSPNPSLCDQQSVILNAEPQGSNQIYRWSYSKFDSYGFSPLEGATSASHIAKVEGYYKVKVFEPGGCFVESEAFYVSEGASVKLTGMDGSTDPVQIDSWENANLKVSLYGSSSPFTFRYYDGIKYSDFLTSSNSEYVLSVSPDVSRTYHVEVEGRACVNSIPPSNDLKVIVNQSPNLGLPEPVSLNYCVGEILEIPISNLPTSDVHISVYLRGVSSIERIFLGQWRSASPGRFIIPEVSAGEYKVVVNTFVPDAGDMESTYSLNISNSSACSLVNAQILAEIEPCAREVRMLAYPRGPGYSYTWYRDDVIIQNVSLNYCFGYSNGDYKVKVIGPNGYSSTSEVHNVDYLLDDFYFYNTTLDCEDGQIGIQRAGNSAVGDSYQWYFSELGDSYSPLNGETNVSLTGGNVGFYFCSIQKGACNLKSSVIQSCPFVTTFNEIQTCKGTNLELPVSLESYIGYYTLSLVDASNEDNVILPAFHSENFNIGQKEQIVNLQVPDDLAAGQYKIKMSMANRDVVGEGIINVSNNTATDPPVITASPYYYKEGDTLTLTATGCTGDYLWDNGFEGAERMVNQSISYGFWVTCQSGLGLCPTEKTYIWPQKACDAIEPNDLSEEAFHFEEESYTSPGLCFGSAKDEDWFSFIVDGSLYFIRIMSASTDLSGRQYRLVFSKSGTSITLKTESVIASDYLPVYMELYDVGENLLSFNSYGSENGHAKIVYDLEHPCPLQMSMYSNLFDVSGMSSPQAEHIEATNAILNGAEAGYSAEKSIELNPGFKTEISDSGYFKAEIKNCVD
ncbi:hypothetical protein LAG90_15400 [Marinilongibacter aquaticus]|uniref:3-coathanger stack domain-containing protein n=1 Tax=Marinilongibacter aquaticus TaxID=2975157 RepID=UPI0021BDD49E|nr:3-coathanger stack domain-containing protein [Marinilongibacter aquaticus]UBM58192.1 hypothetical protein LAG90_15400 [Marinilongibacter aquaticus]